MNWCNTTALSVELCSNYRFNSNPSASLCKIEPRFVTIRAGHSGVKGQLGCGKGNLQDTLQNSNQPMQRRDEPSWPIWLHTSAASKSSVCAPNLFEPRIIVTQPLFYCSIAKIGDLFVLFPELLAKLPCKPSGKYC